MAEPLFRSDIWDRLVSDLSAGTPQLLVSLASYRASITRDLESLLNTRIAAHSQVFSDFPLCGKSVLRFGLVDFAALCLSSEHDQQLICQNLREAISHFEPRLNNIKTSLNLKRGATNRLDFVISGTLKDYKNELLELKAVFQPSAQRYSISQTRSS